MSSTKTLLNVDYHDDDETGMYRVGEIDFGIHGALHSYIENYGFKGVQEILAMLGHLAYEVKFIYYGLDKALNKESNDKTI